MDPLPLERVVRTHWIIQQNLYGASSLQSLMVALERLVEET